MDDFLNFTVAFQSSSWKQSPMLTIKSLLKEACEDAMTDSRYPNDGNVYCNATFDDWVCWNYTIAGTRSYIQCPKFLESFYGVPPVNARAFKDCQLNGSWWIHPVSKKPWTNYTACLGSQENLQRIIYVYYSGYGASILCLLFALAIFSFCKQIECHRVSLHKNLFLTYVLSGTSWILLYALLDDPETLISSPIWCQVLHVVTQYLTLCNYAWMFCEGFYLHALIVTTFANEKKLLRICYLIGWVVPIIPTVIYAAVRGSFPTLTTSCWSGHTELKWILSGPVAFSLVVNFISLINILRILLSKLRAVNTNEAHQMRRTVRAALILIPLLGLQYLLIPLRPDRDGHVYNIVSAILTSFQGVFVALLFCFLNGEVLSLLRRKLRKKNKDISLRQSVPFSAVQKKFSLRQI